MNEYGCSPDTCQYHKLTESVITDLKGAVEKLLEGQDQMKETVIKLTENMKSFERIDERIVRLEELQRERDKEQDIKIQELRAFMYKMAGALTVIGVVAGLIGKIVIGG